ncbi:MAG: hypothetical protein K0S55_653, partial [Clostridia bacterium]|nr:hypothetical protein [Clostridia bacterium]
IFSSVAGFVIFIAFFYNNFSRMWVKVVSVPMLIISITALCAVGILTIFIPARSLNKTNIIDGIKIIN